MSTICCPAPSKDIPKVANILGHFEAVFFMKTIFLVKRLVFAYHDVHIRKAMPKLDRLRYFGTLFVHSVMRQIFVNTVGLILYCVLYVASADDAHIWGNMRART